MSAVRDARPEDAADVAGVHVASWKAAYRGLLPDRYLDELSVADRLAWWTEHLRVEPAAGEATLVVQDHGEAICGFALTRRDHETVALLGAIYLRPESWGRGLGQALHHGVADRLRAQGYEKVVLWVHPDNVRARRFYRALGYADDNVEQTENAWGLEVPARRLRLSLG